jgi:hypothetical protein
LKAQEVIRRLEGNPIIQIVRVLPQEVTLLLERNHLTQGAKVHRQEVILLARVMVAADMVVVLEVEDQAVAEVVAVEDNK